MSARRSRWASVLRTSTTSPNLWQSIADCHLETQVDVSEMMGAEIYLYLEYKGNKMTARVAPTSKARNGDTVRVAFDPHKVHLSSTSRPSRPS